MKEALLVVLFIVVFYLIYVYFYEYSSYNNTQVAPCQNCETYNVHSSHGDHQAAAELMEDITKRNRILIDHLKKKYITDFSPNMDPVKNGRIDVIPSVEMFPEFSNSVNAQKIKETEYVYERVEQLIHYYDAKQIYEISPLNTQNLTSYTQDKKTLILCLRHKMKNKFNENELHDVNTLMFVVIHELTHMANNEYNHPISFWILFKFMLLNAVECGIYKPVDYSKYPINYCGLNIGYSPLFDGVI